MATPLPNYSPGGVEIKRITFRLDAMIDLMIANPRITNAQLAAEFGYTPSWVSTVTNSDAFRARFAERKDEVVDPSLIATIDERLRAVADSSLKRVLEKLESPINSTDEFLLKSADLAVKALGYGARPAAGSNTTNVAVVIQVPQKIPSSSDWAAAHTAPLAERVS
jgi:hypothetical protein